MVREIGSEPWFSFRNNCCDVAPGSALARARAGTRSPWFDVANQELLELADPPDLASYKKLFLVTHRLRNHAWPRQAPARRKETAGRGTRRRAGNRLDKPSIHRARKFCFAPHIDGTHCPQERVEERLIFGLARHRGRLCLGAGLGCGPDLGDNMDQASGQRLISRKVAIPGKPVGYHGRRLSCPESNQAMQPGIQSAQPPRAAVEDLGRPKDKQLRLVDHQEGIPPHLDLAASQGDCCSRRVTMPDDLD